LIGSRVGHSLDPLLLRLYRVLFLNRPVSPNSLTVCGLIVSLIVSYLAARGPLPAAGILLVLSGFFDLLDGAVARNKNMVTRFGGFLDSVLDRYSDLMVMFGISVHFLSVSDPFFSMTTFFAAVGVAIIPYARARAEAASIRCDNGLLERSERIILLIIGLVFGGNVLKAVVAILAVLTHITVVQRVWVTRRVSSEK
jgi:phosphatidylglycerophosphate synthase